MSPPLPPVRVPHPHVRAEPSVLSGSPYVAGSRVPVRRLWAWHRGGSAVETLLKRYPSLGPARVLDALAFAYDNEDVIEADLAREQELLRQEGGEPPPGLRPMAQQPLIPDAGEPARRRRRLRDSTGQRLFFRSQTTGHRLRRER